MKESDLFQPVKELLESKMFTDVYAEVGTYDVVGIGKGYSIIVEMKRNLSWKLIEQALRGVGIADYVFIAIPQPNTRNNRIDERYLNMDGIGIIYVRGDKAFVHSWGRRHKINKRRNSLSNLVGPHHKLTTGGVKSGDGPTQYSLMIDNIKWLLKYHRRNDGWMTVDEILESVETHYSSPKPSVMATLQENWNQDWCESKVENRRRYFRFKKEVK